LDWNDDFGDWQGLASIEQAPRYQRIASLVEQLIQVGSVLDVGCGEAVLRDFLPRSILYRGIEPSAKAIEAHPEVAHSTAEAFEAHGQKWNCIVFNEMLYYARDPLFLLKKYAELLCPGGAFIISIYQRPGMPTPAARIRHWFDRRRPISNVHCTEMVLRFICKNGWSVEHDSLLENRWRIWVSRPTVPA
jgi:SAM-dependent methyltransferase